MDRPKVNGRLRVSSPWVLLPLILIVALGLRFYGIGWDQGYGFHPDERSIYMQSDCMYRVLTEGPGYSNCIRDHPDTEPGFPSPAAFLDADRSPLNPHWFPLGSILIYLIVGFRFLLEPFTDLGSLSSMSYVGRSLVALADVGTVFMVYLLGRRIYGVRVGLLAAAFVALAVVHIQHSHFYRPEPIQVLLLLASFWSMLQLVEKRRLRDSLLLGLFVGLTFATKVSVLPVVLPLALTYGFRLFTSADGGWTVPSRNETDKVTGQALLAAVVAVGVFLFTTPYALLDMFEFVGDVTWQATNVAKTAGKVPFTVQYIGSTPFIYELRQSSLWGLGLPLGIVAWGGVLFTISFVAVKLFRARNRGLACRGELLILAWVVPNVIMLSIFEVKFLRYMFPVMPFLILMGSAMLFRLLDWARAYQWATHSIGGGLTSARGAVSRYAPHMVMGLIALVVAATAFYALAFETVYSRPHPAIQASRWINENVARNSTIVTDNHWDEGIPDIYRYRVRQIPIYDSDNRDKMGTIADHLAEGDYLVFYSNRTYGSVARLPERYPLSSNYYRLLFSGQLGYTPEMAFTSYPRLLGVAFVDDTFTRAGIPEPERFKTAAPLSLDLGYADENVIDYDHPKVLLFRNDAGFSRDKLYSLLMRRPQREAAAELGLMLSPERKVDQREGGTWSEIIKRDSWTNVVPVLAWILLVEIIYLAALPLAIFLFRPLPDRGMVLARLLGILGVCYVAWLLASLGWMEFSRTSVLVGILVVASASAAVVATRWREIKEFLGRNWRLLAIGELLFLAAFLSFVAIRMANPDLWHPFRGGEKPMDFAYLNAVLRSTYMPPYDPWFAGGYLNYYCWGQFIVAALIKTTGIVPSVAYNLAVPLLFALTVTAAYSLVYNLAAGIRRTSIVEAAVARAGPQGCTGESIDEPQQTGGHASAGLWRRWSEGVAWGPVIAGLLAGLFVAVMGNLDGLVQLVQGAWKDLVGGEAFPAFDFWRSSRMLPALEDVTPSVLTFWLPDRTFVDTGHHITEFPFFSFLFADLHAHMIAIPFTLLAVGLAFSLLVGLSQAVRGWWLVLTASALAVSAGSLWAINSWDYPAYTLLALLLIGGGVYLGRGMPLAKVALFLALATGVVVLSIVAFLPFHTNYHPYPAGLVVSKWQTPLHNYLGIHGLFIFVSATFVIYLLRRQLQGLLTFLTTHPSALWEARASAFSGITGVPWAAAAGVLGAVLIIYMAAAGYWTAAVLTLILAPTLWATKNVLAGEGEGRAYALFPLVLISMALLIGIGTEFIRAKDDIGRMNTLFKYYLGAWTLFALASSYILWYLASSGAFRLRGLSVPRGVWMAVVALLLVAGFIYPILGTRARLADRFDTQNMTLDGADYMERTVYRKEGTPIEFKWDRGAIRWLQDNVRGSPVVLEAHNEQYTWSSRIANYTGLPTVIGWPWHQIQQRMRYRQAVGERASAVREIYSTTNVARGLHFLRQYEVEYVVVGELERAYYPERGLRKFDRMVEDGLARVVYQNEGAVIYQAAWYD